MALPKNDFVTGFFISKLSKSEILLATQHVNTVYNRHQHVQIVDEHLFKHKINQSGVVKSKTNKFVTDKKKCFTMDGLKNTRIEFTNTANRSSNYTTNAPVMYHSMYHAFFDIICLSQGELVTHTGPLVMNNTNYTSCVYGATNYFILFIRMINEQSVFNRPILFPSWINPRCENTRHQLFSSLYLNSQRVDPRKVDEIGSYVEDIAQFIEYEPFLNKLCCDIVIEERRFINSPNKLLLVWLNELFYMVNTKQEYSYKDYKTFMMLHFSIYRNNFFNHASQIMNQYRSKNIAFNHFVPYFLFRENKDNCQILSVLNAYNMRMQKKCFTDTLIEFNLLIHACVEQVNDISKLKVEDSTLYIDGKPAIQRLWAYRDSLASFSEEAQRALKGGIAAYCQLVYFTMLPTITA
uniref:SAM-dependent MTase RsmB/NOP-type domain-containing protein n=1 Tax=Ranid herpesvirus 4 TaxID=2849006 RepID=A0A8F3CIJ3_9VIRU|nr:MAG: hypothetical protein [Ranid herpesvirus 4]